MYVGVIFYRFRPDRIDDAIKAWRDMVIPEARKHQGFIRAEMFADRETGRGMDIGYWQTRENAAHFEESGAYGFLINELSDYLEVPPQRMQFEKVLEV